VRCKQLKGNKMKELLLIGAGLILAPVIAGAVMIIRMTWRAEKVRQELIDELGLRGDGDWWKENE
jgi:hypothetical protein